MGVTVGQLRARTQRRLNGGRRVEVNRLTAAVDTDDETVTFDFDLGGIVEGSYLGIGNEILRVWDVSGSSANVARGELGTEAEAHDEGTIVEVSARFFAVDIRQALKEEVDTLGPDLFRVHQLATIGLGTDIRGFDLVGVPDGAYGVLDVSMTHTGTSNSLMRPGYRTTSTAPVSGFASGWAILLDYAYDATRSLHVAMAIPFDTSAFDDDTDLETDVGLAARIHDVVMYGAMWRLMAGDEATRSEAGTFGEYARAEEIPPGYRLQQAEGFRRIRDARYSKEVAYLRGLYPYRSF